MLLVSDLERVEALDSQTSAATECTCLFLSSQLILTEVHLLCSWIPFFPIHFRVVLVFLLEVCFR